MRERKKIAPAVPSMSVDTQLKAGQAATPLHRWIHQLYHDKGFVSAGFIGWKAFARLLIEEEPGREQQIRNALQE